MSERRRPIEGPDGGTRIERTSTRAGRTYRTTETRTKNPQGGSNRDVTTEDITPDQPNTVTQRRARQETRQQSRASQLSGAYRNFAPTRVGEKVPASVGLLEAEFIGAELIVFIELFTNSGSYGDKIMATMRRGMLTAMLFFILAIIAGAGPNAAKISKAIGALVIISILLTSPAATMISGLDDFIKGDWTGSDESGNPTTSNPSGTSTPGNQTPSTSQTLSSALKAKLNQLAPGLGSEIALQANSVGAEYDVDRLAAGILTGNPTAIKNAASAFGDKVKSTISDIYHFF